MEVCGLYKPEFVEVTDILKSITHAVDEEDWERLGEKDYQKAISELESFARTMDNAGCRCLPHGMFDPSEIATVLRRAIEQKAKGNATSSVASLALALLQDVKLDIQDGHK